LDDDEIPNGVWVTIGVSLWTDYQDIVAEARRTGFLKDDKDRIFMVCRASPGTPK
jgi:hypothetical protein